MLKFTVDRNKKGVQIKPNRRFYMTLKELIFPPKSFLKRR